MNIILMRGASSESYEQEPRDQDRGLTAEGRQDVATAAAFLNALDIHLDAILASPFKRARQTAEELSRQLPEAPAVTNAQAIMPGAGVEELMRAVCNRVQCTTTGWVLAVGHEPDIGRTLHEALGPQSQYRFPVAPGDLFGLALECHAGTPSGRLIFAFSPINARD
jgi:phosphohistidine phosphatase SixA